MFLQTSDSTQGLTLTYNRGYVKGKFLLIMFYLFFSLDEKNQKSRQSSSR